MTPEQFQRVGELYDAALELAPETRSDFLAAACEDEEGLRFEVESLLLAHEQSDGFIAANVASVAAEFAAQQKPPSMLGRSLSHYQVLSLLGTGGMGEVYLAQDTRLGRKVALKLLPHAFTRDQERLRRFKQEALATSSLNHPNILTVYDIGAASSELGGVPFIVAELLEGVELRRQLNEGPLSVRRVVDYARQIAAGLAAAHEKGVVHRDLKPENIFVTKDGLVKILDFGLAKLFKKDEGGGMKDEAVVTSLHHPSSLRPHPLTSPGMVMGTVGYMSPEQVRGQEADYRSDIFAFGLVLYEMLAGRQAFQGESPPETLAAIVNQEPPDITEANPKIPPQLERIVNRCLEKQPERRFQTASDLGFALESLLTPSGARLREQTVSSPAEAITVLPRQVGREKSWMAATALAALLAAGFAWAFFTRSSPPDAPPMKLLLLLPEKTKYRYIAVSPDGAWLAFTKETGKTSQLWTLALATREAKPLQGAEDGVYPFWSPDSRFIGFFTADKLKKIEVAGGLPITLCDIRKGVAGSWSREGVIIFGRLDGGELSSVSATGGTPAPVLRKDVKRQELSIRFPSFLPDGRHFLYTVGSDDKDVRGIYFGSLDGGTRQRLLGDYSNVSYVASDKDKSSIGYLLFGHERSLVAQPFDAKTLRLSGEPITVANQIATTRNSVYRIFSASDKGVLVFDPEPKREHKRLLWVERAGRTLNTLEQFDDLRIIRLAPDGKRFAATTYDLPTNNFDLWLSDVTGGNPVRFTFDPADDYFGVWSPDTSRIAWSAHRDGAFHLYEKAVNGTGQEALLFRSEHPTIPTDWSRDGRYIIFRQIDPKTRFDLWALPLFGERKPFPLLQTMANEGGGVLSPDGLWLAYHSDESGRHEIYVQHFSDGSGKRRVSTNGGGDPQWRGDGKELYYHALDNKLMAVSITGGASLAVGAPVAMVEFPYNGDPEISDYAVSRDGQRFLLNTTVESQTNPPLTVLLNWKAGEK